MSKSNIFSISHIGNSRETQEDNFLLYQGGFLPSGVRDSMAMNRKAYSMEHRADSSHFLVAVSDGMGGHACGEIASSLTVKFMSEQYEEMIASAMLGDKAVSGHIQRLNNLICKEIRSKKEYRGMGATLCGVVAKEYELFGFNVGDSRLYQLYNGHLKQLSTDHTEGQRLLGLNLLTEAEVKKFPRQKELYRYIGYAGDLSPEVFRINCAISGSLLMLCTDGLSDALTDIEMEQILSYSQPDLNAKGKRLVDEAIARNPGHGDNITVILVEF